MFVLAITCYLIFATIVTDVLTEGQVIPVKLLEVDKQGRLNLSYIDALEN